MQKKTTLFLILSVLSLSYSLCAQQLPKTILLKVNSSHHSEVKVNENLSSILLQCDGSIHQVFPHHQTPIEPTDQFGNTLIDLSLWYIVVYKSNVTELLVINKLRLTGLFQFVEQRARSECFYFPNDPYQGSQYYLHNIKAFQAWDIEQGDTNVVVGITDTGIDRLHEDLADGLKYNYQDPVDGIDNDNDGFIDNFCGWDLGNNDNNVQWGPIGHGTFVAGFVSAVVDNGVGISGVGYNTKSLIVKIDDTSGDLIRDYEGIVYAADHGCSVINCAWGGPVYTHFGQEIVNYATFNRNALVVAACGNSDADQWFYPASFDNVLSIAATDSLDVRWSQSSFGTQVDLCAPGTFVYSTWVNDGYISSHGTSFSAPMVAAAAALLKSQRPWLSALQLGEQLRVSTDYIDSLSGNPSTAGMMGSGRLNILKALSDTLSPSIRLSNIQVQISDTLSLIGTFTNYLENSSSNLKATISTQSPYLEVLDSTYNIGVLYTMQMDNNHNYPFTIKVLPGYPIGYTVDLKITYQDVNYSSFEYVRIALDKDFETIDTNKIALTLTSNSRIGFNDETQNQGIGLVYKGGRSMLAFSGLMVATSSNLVSDNIYDDVSYSKDFYPIKPLMAIKNPLKGDKAFYCEYNDDSAGFFVQGIKVNQYSYAYNQVGSDKYVIIEYTLFNEGSSTLFGLYAGLFADFDIEKSSNNKAFYDANYKMAYTRPSVGGKHAAIMLLEGSNPNIYNIDNNGSGGSVNLYDGFYDFEKYQCLTQKRDSAGYTQAFGGDVSSIISSGSHTLPPGDSLKLSFALLAGDNLYDLKQSAQSAIDHYYNTTTLDTDNSPDELILHQNTPNPFSKTTGISFYNPQRQTLKLEVYDFQGRYIQGLLNNEMPEGSHQINFDSGELNSGIYYVRLASSKESKAIKIILIQE